MRIGKTRFSNSWYPIILVFFIGSVIYSQIVTLKFGFTYNHLIYSILVISVLLSLIYFKYTHIIVRVLGLLSMAGGCLGIISILLYLVSDSFDSGHFLPLIIYIFNLVMGFIIYHYYHDSVIELDETHSN